MRRRRKGAVGRVVRGKVEKLSRLVVEGLDAADALVVAPGEG